MRFASATSLVNQVGPNFSEYMRDALSTQPHLTSAWIGQGTSPEVRTQIDSRRRRSQLPGFNSQRVIAGETRKETTETIT